MTREVGEGRELFKDFKQIGGGGEACVYDVGNDTLLRVMQAHRFVVPQQYFHESNIINTFEQIRAQHMHFSVIKTLGYFIFSSEPSKLFYPNTIFKEEPVGVEQQQQKKHLFPTIYIFTKVCPRHL